MARDSHTQSEQSDDQHRTDEQLPSFRENADDAPLTGGRRGIPSGSRRDILRWGAAAGALSLIGGSSAAGVAATDGSSIDDGHVEALVELNYYVDEAAARVLFDVAPEVVADVPSARAQAVLARPDGSDVEAKGPLTENGTTVLELPIDGIQTGVFPVTLRIDAGGSTLWEGIDAVVKRSAPPEGTPVTQIDRYRRNLIVDGERFFPMGIFGVYPEHMADVADAGFNLTMRWKGATINGPDSEHRFDHTEPWDSDYNQETVLPYLDAAAEAGLYVLENPPKLAWENEAPENLYINYHDPNWHEKWPTHAYEIAPGIVRNARDHPAVVGYYSFDEPDNVYPTQPDHPRHLLMEEGVEEWYRVVNGLDPYHAIHTLFAVGLSKNADWNRDDDSDAWDVPMRDFYVKEGQHMSLVHDVAKESAATAEEMHEPFLYTPMFEDFSARVKPLTGPEQRAQTYLSLTADIKGLFYWEWPARYHENWEMLKQLASEVDDLAPILLERAPEQEVNYATSGTENAVKALVKNHDGRPNESAGVVQTYDGTAYLIVVNAEPAPVDVTYQLPEKFDGEAAVWFEDRTVDLSQGTFSDTFEPYGRHVYELPGGSWEEGAAVTLDLEVGEAIEYVDPQFEPAEENLLKNGSFEYDYGGLPGFPAEWNCTQSVMSSGEIGTDDGNWTAVTGDGVHGDRCLQMTKTAPGRGDLHDMFNLLTTPRAHQDVAYLGDGPYTFSVWLKADEEDTRAWVWLTWSLYEFDVGTEWERFEITHDGGAFVRIMLADQGTLWVDGAQIETGSTATDYHDLEPTNVEDL